MIISALVKRYEDTADVKPGWQRRIVHFALDISENGELLGVIPLGDPSDKKTAYQTLTVPSIGSGRSGKNAYETAYFLCDDGGYMLGLDPKKFASAQKLHTELLFGIDSPAAKAITAYFSAGIPVTPDGTDVIKAAQQKYIFLVNGRRVDYDDADNEIINAWQVQYKSKSIVEDEDICLVTGERDSIIRLHDKVELRGVTMGKQPLISMNEQTSFRSYGETKGDPPAKVGAKAAFAYVSALNGLLNDDKHHQFIGSDTLVYWAEGDDTSEAELFSLLASPKESDDMRLSSIMAQVTRGKLPDIENVNWSKRFFILCMSPNAARISVRFFHVDNFANIIKHIDNHYNNLEIYSSRAERFNMLPYWLLLSETTVKKTAADSAPLIGGQLFSSIITGSRYPVTLYNAILSRVRAGEEVNRIKASVIKAVLIRNFNESEVATVSLNPDSTNLPYTLGRLFSVLERLQERANGSANIRERYFTSACANPGSVFPTLLKLSVHHSAKLDNAVFFEKSITELLGRLSDEAPFPAAQSLDDQGRFVLGYYHQTQDFFTPKKDKEMIGNE